MNVAYLHPYLSYRHYPAIYGDHIHSELASIHHDYLLREQADLEKYYRTSAELFASEKVAAYETEIRLKQQRIKDMVDQINKVDNLEKERLRGLSIQEQLRREQLLRQMQVDRYLSMFHPQASRNSYHKKINEVYDKSTLDRDEKYFSQKRQEVKENQDKKHLKDQLHPNSIKLNQRKAEKNTIKESNPYVSYQELSEPISKRTSQKKNHCVKINQSFQSSRQRKNIAPKNRKHCLSSSRDTPSKRIQRRLKVSQVTYKDAEWKNIKHEILHLSKTYDQEKKQRKSLKSKINNNPKIVQKYNLIVEKN